MTTDDDFDDKLLKDEDSDKDISRNKEDELARWSEKTLEKYNELRDTVNKNIPNLWQPLEFALSIKTILNIKGCIKPFGGILLGPPSSLKTVTIDMFRGCKHTFYSDNFSARAWVTHNAGVKKEKLSKLDLLPKIKNKFFLTPELAPTFSAKEDDLLANLGIITRVLDGEGYESDSGAQGHRGYKGEYMFTWLGASVDIPHRVHKALSTLGPRLFFLRLPKLAKSEDYYYRQMREDFEAKEEKIKSALYEYIANFELHPQITYEVNYSDEAEEEEGLPKMPLNHTKDEENAIRIIIKLGKLLAQLRAEVPTWETNDTQGSDYGYSNAIIEEPMRAIRQLCNLAWGHALSKGSDYVAMDDIPMIIDVVFSTCSIERNTIFDLLIANEGVLKTSDIVDSLNVSSPTAKRTMTELKATGLVDMQELKKGMYGSEKQIILSDKFSWFLSPKFKELNDRRLKEKSPGRRYHAVLLVYYYSIINKKIKTGVCNENTFNVEECLRGGENSFNVPTADDNSNSSSPDFYRCYYCKDFTSINAEDYQKHVVLRHGKPAYPSKADLDSLKLVAQGKKWEI